MLVVQLIAEKITSFFKAMGHKKKKLAFLDGSQIFFLLNRTVHEFFKKFVNYFPDPLHSINNDRSLISTVMFWESGLCCTSYSLTQKNDGSSIWLPTRLT